jgi:hypothetical protein
MIKVKPKKFRALQAGREGVEAENNVRFCKW